MTTLELEADKVRLVRAILNIEDVSVMAEVKKYLNNILIPNAKNVKNNSVRTRPVSRDVLNMVVGELPVDMDVEKETDRMWEELAK